MNDERSLKTEKETYISGVQRNDYPITITKEGLTPFGVPGYSEETDVNTLSFAQIAEYCTYWHKFLRAPIDFFWTQ